MLGFFPGQERRLAETGTISMPRQAKILLQSLNIFPCLHSACYKMERKVEINLQVSTCETRLSKTIISADWGGVCVGKAGKENMVSPES